MKTKSSSVKPTCTYVIQSRVGEQPEVLCGNPVKYTYKETLEGGRVRVYDTHCEVCNAKPPRAEQIQEALDALAAMPFPDIDIGALSDVAESVPSEPELDVELTEAKEAEEAYLTEAKEAEEAYLTEAKEAEEAYQEIVDNEMPPEVQKEVAAPSQTVTSSDAKYDRWVKAVRLWAERHPKQNGGYITMCWTDAEIRTHLISQGVQNQKQATDEFYAICQVNKEMAEEAQNA